MVILSDDIMMGRDWFGKAEPVCPEDRDGEKNYLFGVDFCGLNFFGKSFGVLFSLFFF